MRISTFIIAALAASQSSAAYDGVMADETTGAVVPTSLEARIVSGAGGGTGSGSGFPLATNGNLNQFSLTNGLTVQATNGVFKTLTAQSTSAGTLSAGTSALGPTTVTGDLIVYGNRVEDMTITVTHRTNVFAGTNYIYQDVYSTQVVYQSTVVVTGTTVHVTNDVTTYVNVGGSFTMGSNSTFDATNANVVKFPGLVSTNTSTGAVTTVTGTLDIAGANVVGLPSQGITNLGSGLSGNGLDVPLSVVEQDPLSIHTNAIGTGLVWTNNQLVVTGEGTAIVTNEVDPRRYDAFREYAALDASSGTGTITTASGLWLSLAASDQPRTLAMWTDFDAAQAWRFNVMVARGTNGLSIDTNLVGYSFLSLPVSSTNHVLIDRYPGDASFRVLQVHR